MQRMTHFFQDMPGWFDFEDVYRTFVNTASSPAHFVEVGTWYGKSAAFLGVEIVNSMKDIRLDVVDHWRGSWEHSADGVEPDAYLLAHGSIFEKFLHFTAPLKDVINPIVADSLSASQLYDDLSLDLVFLDASHKEVDVRADIAAWYPKVRVGGILAGHDFTLSWPGVVAAVTQNPYFKPSQVLKAEACWVHHKTAAVQLEALGQQPDAQRPYLSTDALHRETHEH